MKRDEARMREDRALRDASLALVKADVAHMKRTFSTKSLAQRAAGRISEGAVDVFDEAVDVADSNRGVLAALVAAVVIWFARNPIMALFEDTQDSLPGEDNPSQAD